jgi:hypothetical protein
MKAKAGGCFAHLWAVALAAIDGSSVEPVPWALCLESSSVGSALRLTTLRLTNASLAQHNKPGDAADDVRVLQQRHMGISMISRSARRARIASTVSRDRMSEFPPRITISGTRASASNCAHSGGSGRSRFDPVQNPRELRVIGREQPGAPFSGAPRLPQPVGGAEIRELRCADPSQDIGTFFEGPRPRQFAEQALDADQPPGLGYRADVVEDVPPSRSAAWMPAASPRYRRGRCRRAARSSEARGTPAKHFSKTRIGSARRLGLSLVHRMD